MTMSGHAVHVPETKHLAIAAMASYNHYSSPGLAFGRTQPRSGPNPDRESQYFGSDRVETSSIRSDIGLKIGRT